MSKDEFTEYGYDEDWIYPQKPHRLEKDLHPGAVWSMRSHTDASGHSNQCIYDKGGSLVTEPTTGGTVDWAKSKTRAHIAHDVTPIYFASKLDGGGYGSLTTSFFNLTGPIPASPGPNMAKYFEVRPSH